MRFNVGCMGQETSYNLPMPSHDKRNGALVTGQDSCKANARGPLCSLCEDDYFLGGNGRCEECSESQVMASLAWIVAALILLVALAALWRPCSQNDGHHRVDIPGKGSLQQQPS